MQDSYEIILLGGLVWANLAIVLTVIAWWCARNTKLIRLHRSLMLLLAAGGWLFVSAYLLQLMTTGPNLLHIPQYIIPWFVVHAVIGIVPLIGAPLLIWARLRPARHSRLRNYLNRNHIRIGRILVPIWIFTHIGGIINYVIVY